MPDETITFLSVDLSLSGVLQTLISQRDNTWIQISRCSHWYKERAFRELYPGRKSQAGLRKPDKEKIINRAIEMATSDSRNGVTVPPLS